MLFSRVSKGEEFSKRESIFNNHGTAYEVLTVKKDHEQRLNYTQANFCVCFLLFVVFCCCCFFSNKTWTAMENGGTHKLNGLNCFIISVIWTSCAKNVQNHNQYNQLLWITGFMKILLFSVHTICCDSQLITWDTY